MTALSWIGLLCAVVPAVLFVRNLAVFSTPPLACGQWTMVAATAAFLALLPRVIAVRRFHQPLVAALLHPIAILALLAIQWAGLIRWLRGDSVSWKGRAYHAAEA